MKFKGKVVVSKSDGLDGSLVEPPRRVEALAAPRLKIEGAGEVWTEKQCPSPELFTEGSTTELRQWITYIEGRSADDRSLVRDMSQMAVQMFLLFVGGALTALVSSGGLASLSVFVKLSFGIICALAFAVVVVVLTQREVKTERDRCRRLSMFGIAYKMRLLELEGNN